MSTRIIELSENITSLINTISIGQDLILTEYRNIRGIDMRGSSIEDFACDRIMLFLRDIRDELTKLIYACTDVNEDFGDHQIISSMIKVTQGIIQTLYTITRNHCHLMYKTCEKIKEYEEIGGDAEVKKHLNKLIQLLDYNIRLIIDGLNNSNLQIITITKLKTGM